MFRRYAVISNRRVDSRDGEFGSILAELRKRHDPELVAGENLSALFLRSARIDRVQFRGFGRTKVLGPLCR